MIGGVRRAASRVGWCLGVLLCLATVPALAATDESYDDISDRAANAFWWGDFAELERLHERYSKPGELLPSGRPKLVAFRRGLGRVFTGHKDEPDAYFVEIEALTRQWAAQHPRSSLAHAMHAEALLKHAWSYRGTGFANTVPPQAWQDFRDYVQRAAAYLAANANDAFASSSAYVTAIDVGRAAGWDRDRLWAIGRAGLAKNPDDDGIYASMLYSVSPKWGGSAVVIDRFIDEVVVRTRAERGLEMYARMYAWAASDEFKHAIFTQSGAEWPKMKQGFEDMLRRFPDPGNVNRFAYFACLAEDKPTALDLLARVGAKPDLDQWGDNGARSFETCKRWASRQ